METTELRIITKEEKSHIGLILITILIIFFIIFFLLFLGITLYISSSEKIITGVYVKGVEVAGLTKEEAVKKVKNEFAKALPNDITLFHNEYETQINLSDLGVNFKVEDAIEDAYKIGRSANILKNMGTIMKSLVTPVDLKFNVTVDYNTASAVLNDISTKLPDTIVQSSYYVDRKKLIITKGKNGNIVDVEPTINNIKSRIEDLSYANKKVEIATVEKAPDAIDIEKIHKELYKEPVNAYYTTDPYVVHPHENGVNFKISMEQAKELLKEDKEEYQIPLKYTSPSVTTSMIGTEAFPDMISTYSTKYNAGNKDRTTNLKLAAEKINGTVLMPGETFSYNTVVGERTIAAGYKEAPIYQNGDVVDGLGGGICQISTTLYNAALYANLQIVERRNHQFVPSYAPAGRDATVVYGSIDFKFKNSRNYPIKIMCTVSGGVAKCTIFGLKENPDYDVEITAQVTDKTATSLNSSTYKVVRQNGQVISSERINRDTYKRH